MYTCGERILQGFKRVEMLQTPWEGEKRGQKLAGEKRLSENWIMFDRMCQSLALATSRFLLRTRTGRSRTADCCSSTTLCSTLFVDIFHLEDHLECCVEYFVQSLLFLGRALNKTLEGVLFSSCLNLSIWDALTEFCSITISLQLFTEIELGANKNAGASSGSGFDLGDPLAACVFKGVALHEREADDETVGVGVSNWAETTQVLVTSGVPDLQLDFTTLVVLGSIVGVKHGWLIQGGEGLLCPCHDNGGLADSGITDKYELHVVLLVLINQGFCLHHCWNSLLDLSLIY